MSAKKMFLAGAAGLVAAVGFASPAAAQYYPAPNYGYNQGGGLGQILGTILGYGRYPYGNYGYGQTGQYGYQTSRTAVDQCARAVEARLNGYDYNRGYNNYGYNQGYGYDNRYGYNQGYNQARVAGISHVERKSYGYKVHGVATNDFGYGSTYRSGYGQPNMRFTCKVQANGYVRDIDIDRNMAGYRYGYGW